MELTICSKVVNKVTWDGDDDDDNGEAPPLAA